MKEKDGGNVEDTLAQLSNSRTSEANLKLLYQKLNNDNLSNVQRVRVLKLVTHHITKDGCTLDLLSTALKSALPIIKAELCVSTNPAYGAIFNFLEVCYKFVKDYVIKPSDQRIDSVAVALEILSFINTTTASKLFSNHEDELLSNLVFCLKKDKLKLPSLSLLDVCLSEASLKTTMKNDAYIQSVYPLLFNLEDSGIRSAAIAVLLKTDINSKTLPFWNQLKEDTQRIYCKQIVEMVNQKLNWPEIWQFVVKMFGEELHSGGQLINHMLEVLERAFKHSDFEWTRVQAFQCWNTLIDNFRSGLKNKKRIDLIMIPLKANNHRIEILASAKLDTYNHLLKSLGKDLSIYPDVLLSFFSFCFGSEKVTCPPVKSYPALHEKCLSSICSIFKYPFIKDVFNKIHKELIQAAAECFMLERIENCDLLNTLWDSLMGLVQEGLIQEGSNIVKEVFNVVNSLVNKAAIGETSANFKMRRSISPPGSPLGPRPPNKELGTRIVLIIMHSIIQGRNALPTSLFRNKALYIGSLDVMNGTPHLLFIEWLLSPALKLGAANTTVYNQLMSKIISLRRDESTRFMDFVQQVLRKLFVVDESWPTDCKVLSYKCAAENWCILVNEIVEYLQDEGSINQGDAAEHDFRAVYSVLMFPVQNLHVDFELVKGCCIPWKNLFYESCQQAALIATASIQHLCEEVCIRLVAFSKRNSSPEQNASIFFFLTNILNVAFSKFNSVKRAKWVLEHISGIMKELNNLSLDEEILFSQAAVCVHLCLQHSSVTKDVVCNVSPILCSLLNVEVRSPELTDDLCSALCALKQASLMIHQHGLLKETVITMLNKVVLAGKNHSSQKIRASIRQLSNIFEEKISPVKEKSASVVNGSALTGRLTSPKSVTKKLSTIQMSPSNLSPGNSKRKVSTCGSDAKFVRIETPPKKIILTEHQKEVRRERRQDIPALYQDLSQTSQSMTQDITQDIAASASPKKTQNGLTIDEDAVMDTEDVEHNMEVLFSKLDSPTSFKKSKIESGSNCAVNSFIPPAGFVLPTENSSLKSDGKGTNSEGSSSKNQEYSGKGKENGSTPSKADKLAEKTTRAITRSSSHTNLTTRSGKVVKRASLSLTAEPDSLKKKKSARKSLPVNGSEEPFKKNSSENALMESDTTDTESISSITSDNSGAGTKSLKMVSSNRRRSLKRELSQEIALESERKSNGVKNIADIGEDKKEQNDKVSSAEKSKKNAQDLSQAKIAGKVLTRSRSNSSLDELINTSSSKNKIDVADSQSRAMSPIAEVDCPVVKSPTKSYSPSQNASALAVRNNCMETRSDDKSEVEMNQSESGASPISTVKPSSPQVSKPKFKESPKTSKSASPVNGAVNQPSNSSELCDASKSCKDIDGKLEADSQDEIDVLERTSQSQEVIESSQEPVSKMKQCVVSLELFRCAGPKEKVELKDTIVEHGPDSSSPFKVLPKTDNDISPTASKLVCRSLNMDDVESIPLAVLKQRISSEPTKAISPEKDLRNMPLHADNPVETLVSPKRATISSNTAVKETSILLNEPEEKNLDPASLSEPLPAKWNSSMPEWMHEKKGSPPNKAMRTIRSASSRSQAFLKSVSPPKVTDVSPLSSPVQSKRIQKTDSNSNTTPIIKRSSRAAQLLGLGQAAAARGGDTVVSNGNRCNRPEGEEMEVTVSAPSSSSGCSSVPSSISTNVVSASASTVSVVASPSVRRQGRVIEMVTPQKSLEDEGLKKDWVRKTPCAKATPESSILKRKREVDTDTPSPSLKRKRVSFRDPPLSSILRFGETTEIPGTVFSSDPSHDLDRAIEKPNTDQDQEKSKSTQEEDVVHSLDTPSDSEITKSKRLLETESVNSGPGTNLTGLSSKIVSDLENDKCCDSLQNRSMNSISVSDEQKSNSPDQSKCDQTNFNVLHKENDKAAFGEDRNLQISERDSSDTEQMDVEDVLSQGKCVQNNSEQGEAGTEGMLDDLPHLPSGLSPVYPNLVTCIHSVECISSKLTAPVWKKSLLREFSEQGISTIGDLAKLTQERLDRLSVKPPKRTNVCSVLEDFEKRHEHLRDGVICSLSKDCLTSCNHAQVDMKDVLANASDEEIVAKLAELGRMPKLCSLIIKESDPLTVAENIAFNKNVLQALPVDSVAETYLSQVGKSSGRVEKNMSVEGLALILSRVQAGVLQDTIFPAVPSILSSVLSDSMQNYVLREFSSSEIVDKMDKDKVCQLLDPVSNRLNAEEFASKVIPKLTEHNVAKYIDKSKIEGTVKALLSKLDFHESLKILFDYGRDNLQK